VIPFNYRMPFMIRWILILALLYGCEEPQAEPDCNPEEGDPSAECVTYPLMDNNLWEVVPEEEDPFFASADAPQACPEENYGVEVLGGESWYSVKTVNCNYLTVKQTLLEDVPEGAYLQVRIWHFQITLGEGTYRHVLAAGDNADVVYEAEQAVPTEKGGLLPYERFQTPRAMQAGETLYWHLSNHGENSWHLIEFAAIHAQ